MAAELFAQGGYRDLVAVSGAVIYDVSVVEEPDGFRQRASTRIKRSARKRCGRATGTLPSREPGCRQRSLCGPMGQLALRAGARRPGRRLSPDWRDQSRGVQRGQCAGRDRRSPGPGGARGTGHPDRSAHDPPSRTPKQALAGGDGTAGSPKPAALPGGLTRHTTLTVLVTNVAFPRELLRQLGRQVHSSMARAIQPFHTPEDGDVLFTARRARSRRRASTRPRWG